MKTMINIKADKDVKEDAQKLAKELGFSLSAIINASLKQFVRTREVYFSSAYKMTPRLEKLLDKVEADIKKGKNLAGPFETDEDLMKYLDA